MAAVKDKDLTPLIMWFILLAGIVVLTFIRLQRMAGAADTSVSYWDVLFIGLYTIWMIIELRVTRKDVNTEGKKTADFMTCQAYGLGQALTILTGLWFAPVGSEPTAAHFWGMGIFLIGIGYRLWAVRSLGQFYSHRVRTVEQHQVVRSGPYRFTRHPAYAGMIIANAGLSLYFFNWVTVCVFLFILVPAIMVRILIEEKTLYKVAGYSEYAKSRKRLFPALW